MDVAVRQELIASAAAPLNPHHAGDRLAGDVSTTLVTDAGDRFTGVCIDTGSGTGSCAEASAIAAMVTAGQHRTSAIVAVWRSDGGQLHVLPPCGRCREFIRQVHPDDLDTVVLLAAGRCSPLRDLLPEHGWPPPEADDQVPGRQGLRTDGAPS